jgi:hypothetical protein
MFAFTTALFIRSTASEQALPHLTHVHVNIHTLHQVHRIGAGAMSAEQLLGRSDERGEWVDGHLTAIVREWMRTPLFYSWELLLWTLLGCMQGACDEWL